MRKTVLLASSDSSLQQTRSLLLESNGYHTAQVSSLPGALALAGKIRPQIVVLGHCFLPEAQAALVEQLHETLPDIWVICMQTCMVRPEWLLLECAMCFAGQPGSRRVRVLDGREGSKAEVIRWPKQRPLDLAQRSTG
jgi:CheY-like chemotaxis protein